MAIAFTNLGASANPDINDGTNATSYANTSWTPPTDGIIVVYVQSRRSGFIDTPSLSGNSLTWTQQGSTLDCGDSYALSLWAADASGATTGATTIDYGSNTQLGCVASFFQVTGVDISGGISAAFVQTPTNTGTTELEGTVTLSAAGNAANRPIAGFVHDVEEANTPRTNWTELDDMSGAGHARSVITEYRDDAFETTGSATWATAPTVWGGIAAELKAEGEINIDHGYDNLSAWTQGIRIV
jgi:hypothetical protein